MKDLIYEQDIKKITITDGSASLVYTKRGRKSTLYDLRYYYDIGDSGTSRYCEYCGGTWDSSISNTCPECGGNARETYDAETVVDLVYTMLEDHCKVIIEFWDGKINNYNL